MNHQNKHTVTRFPRKAKTSRRALVSTDSGQTNSKPVTGYEFARELGWHNDTLGSIALNVHVPFCPVRCLDCQSHAHITHDSAEINRYLDSLQHEVKLVADVIGSNRHVSELHVGGGSPNYLSDTQLVKLHSILESAFQIDDSTAMSISANPKRTSMSQLELLRGLGFSRIDFGVRDLDPLVQLTIGRIQSKAMIREVFDSAREAGFETVGTDLVYGLPGQTIGGMRSTVESMISLAPDRISCTSFRRRERQFGHQRAMNCGDLPSVADKLALFNVVVEMLLERDYAWVGLDCFTRHEDVLCRAQIEHRLKRNWLGYTVIDSNQTLGFGTNAVSEVHGMCVQNHLDIPSWSGSLNTGQLPVRSGFRLSMDDQRFRAALTDLICNMESSEFLPFFNVTEDSGKFVEMKRNGLLAVHEDKVVVTPQGRYILPQIWSDSLPSHHRWSRPI